MTHLQPLDDWNLFFYLCLSSLKVTFTHHFSLWPFHVTLTQTHSLFSRVMKRRRCSHKTDSSKRVWTSKQGTNFLLSLRCVPSFSATRNMSLKAQMCHRWDLPPFFSQHEKWALIQFKLLSTLFSTKTFLERHYKSSLLIKRDVPAFIPHLSSSDINAVSSCSL